MAEGEVHKLTDVYGISRDLPLNYVSRKAVDDALIDNLTRDKHLVIFGSSKQGKTSLRKHCLKESDYVVVHCSNRWTLQDLQAAILKSAGFELTLSATKTEAGKSKVVAKIKAALFGSEIAVEGEQAREVTEGITTKPMELDTSDVNDIIQALDGFTKYIVLEDFHYLPVEVQRDFAVALKAFHEQSKLCFIIVGVWLEEGRLTVYNGDLTGRVHGINADKWTQDELAEVIALGEALLNIAFTAQFKKSLLVGCADSVYVLQEACYQACANAGVHQTQEKTVTLGEGVDVPALIHAVVDQQTGRYNSFISQFADGFQETQLAMYRWLLYPVLTVDLAKLEAGLSFREVRLILEANHPVKKDLNAGNVTQALKSVASLQGQKNIKPLVLDYDETRTRLNVVDRGFLLWLGSQDVSQLLELAGLPVPEVKQAPAAS